MVEDGWVCDTISALDEYGSGEIIPKSYCKNIEKVSV
jgi:hypothetical protein